MGLFSTKKKDHVNTQAVRMIQDNGIVDSARVATARSILTDISISDSLQASSLHGGFRKFEKMFRYAATPKEEGGYYYGLPNATIRDTSEATAIVTGILQSLSPSPIDVKYIHYRPLNNFHMGWAFLNDKLFYSALTGEIGLFSALLTNAVVQPINEPRRTVTVLLDKLVAVHNTVPGTEGDVAGLMPWDSGIANGRPVPLETRNDEAGTEAIEVHYTWVDTDLVVHKAMYSLSLAEYDDPTDEVNDREYYHALYYDGAQYHYWLYDPATKLYPTLDRVFDRPTDYSNFTDQYFPFALYRSYKNSLTTSSNWETERYKSTKKLLDFIGIDYQAVGDGLDNDDDVTHTIEQAVTMMAVPCNSTHKVDIEYLFKYFSSIYDRLPTDAKQSDNAQLSDSLSVTSKTSNLYAIDISDEDFRLVLSFSGIVRRLRAGTLRPGAQVGDYKNELILKDDFVALLGLPNNNLKVRVYSKQVYPGIYEEIRVLELKLRYDIVQKKNGSITGGAEDDTCLIPIAKTISDTMSNAHKEMLYYRSLHIIFNSHTVEKIGWYQRGWFKVVLFIIIVVIMFFSDGVYGWQLASLEAGAEATVLAIAMIWLENIVVELAINFVIGLALAKLAEEVGGEIGLLLAVVAIAYSVYTGYTNTTGIGGVTSSELLMAGNGLLQGVSADTAHKMEQAQDDLLKQTQEQDDAWADLEEVRDATKLDHLLNPNVFVGLSPLFVPGEKPDDYFYRLSHAGNIGTNIFKINENFVRNSLRLPTIADIHGIN